MRHAVCLALAASLMLSASADAASLSVTPATVSLSPGAAQTFKAQVSGIANPSVVWLVNGIRGGAPTIGTITATGDYSAPVDPPDPVTVAIQAALVAEPTTSAQATADIAASTLTHPRFVVAKTGSDANPGTAAAPWLTLQHAADVVPAGAIVTVRGGIYRELVTISRSGSAAKGFTTFAAAPGETPILDGTGLPIPDGQAGLITIRDAGYIRISGFELRNYVSASAARVPVGIYVEGAGDHIEIRNNHVHHIRTTVKTAAGDALGIAVYGTRAPAAISNLVIDGNELDHLVTGFSESLSLSGNVTQFEITRNTIHDNNNIGINIEGFYRTAPVAAFDQARNGLVAANTVYNISSKSNPAYQGSLGADGIYLSGSRTVTVQQNVIHHADIGLEMASETTGRVTSDIIAHNNLIYLSAIAGVSVGGFARTGTGGTSDCLIANNTLFWNDTTRSGSGEIQIQFRSTNNRFYNNIVYANSQGLLLNSFTTDVAKPASLDANLYFSTANAANLQWVWRNRSSSSLAAFRSQTGNEALGQFANPRFANLAAPDLRVAPASPAINRGLNLGLLALGQVDVVGQARLLAGKVDVGAYQH